MQTLRSRGQRAELTCSELTLPVSSAQVIRGGGTLTQVWRRTPILSLLLIVRVLLLASLGTACATQPDDDESVERSTLTQVTLKSIVVTPTTSSLYANQVQVLAATGKYSDGTTKDLTGTVTWTSSSASLATVSATGVVTTVAHGTATITAQSGAFKGKATVKVLVTLNSIAVTPSSTTMPANTTQTLKATGSYDNHITKDLTALATWASSNPSVATVSTTGLVVAIAPGTTTISSSLTGSSAAPVTGTATITVNTATVTTVAVTPVTKSLPRGSSVQFTATATFSDSSKRVLVPPVVTWTSSVPSVATISTTGRATGFAVGVTTITAKHLGSNVSATAKLTVTAAALTSVAVTPIMATVTAGMTQQYVATGLYTDGSKLDLTNQVTWASSSTGIAAISNVVGSAGLATAVAVGGATMTAKDPKTGKTGTAMLTVNAAVLTSLALVPVSPVAPVGTSVQLAAVGTLSDGTTQNVTSLVTWTSSMPTVASVSNATGSQGLASGLVAGRTTINVVDPVTGISQSAVLTVTPAVLTSIAIAPSSVVVPLNTMTQLVATATYSDGTATDVTQAVTWASANGAIVVSNAPGSSGQVTAITLGTSAVTAKDSMSGIQGQATVVASAAILQSISVTPANVTAPLGTTRAFAATAVYSDGTTQDFTAAATWSSNSNTASVSNAAGANGIATVSAPGIATIKATDPATGISGTARLTAGAAILVGISVAPQLDVPLGTTTQLAATATYSDGTTADLTQSATWASTSAAIVVTNTPGSAGQATAVNPGTAVVSATDAASGIHGQATIATSAPILVALNVTPSSAGISVGLTRALGATGVFSDGTTQEFTSAAAWSTSSNVASVSNASGTKGVVTALALGTATITANDPATGISGSAQVTATAAVLVSISVTPQAAQVPLGTMAPLMAMATYSDGTSQNVTESATWASSNSAIVVSNSAGSAGRVTAVSLGISVLSATDVMSGMTGQTMVVASAAILRSIRITPSPATVPLGMTGALAATAVYSDGTTQDFTAAATWSSSSNSASVSNSAGNKGVVTGTALGTATITATDPATGISGGAPLTTSVAVLVAMAVTPGTVSAPVGMIQTFVATGTFSDGSSRDVSTSVMWNSSDPAIGSVSAGPCGGATVTANAPGSTTITAAHAASGLSASGQLNVIAVLAGTSVFQFRLKDAHGTVLTPANASGLSVLVANGSFAAFPIADCAGNYALVAPPGQLLVQVRADGVASQPGLALPDRFILNGYLNVTGNLTTDLVIPSKALTVHITDPSGGPVQGAIISLSGRVNIADCGASFTTCAAPYIQSSSTINTFDPARTDAAGNATLYGFSMSLDVAVTAPDGSSLLNTTATVDASHASTLNVALAQGAQFTFRLVDAIGTVLTPANVNGISVLVANGSFSALLVADVQGTYRGVVPLGQLLVQVRADSVASQPGLALPDRFYLNGYLNVSGNVTTDLVIPTKSLTVHIADPSGGPVQGAIISLSGRGNIADCGASFTTCAAPYSYSSFTTNTFDPARTDAAGNATLYGFSMLLDVSVTVPAGTGLLNKTVTLDASHATTLEVQL